MKSDNTNWVMTHSGRKFFLDDPDPSDIYLIDIARSLSQIRHFNVHLAVSVSVAEHSVALASIVPAHLRVTAMLHDAAEAYIGNIPRPLKDMIPGIKGVENRILIAVGERFGVELAMGELKEWNSRMGMRADERIAAEVIYGNTYEAFRLFLLKCYRLGIAHDPVDRDAIKDADFG